MSKHEPYYTCSICKREIYAEEVSDHSRMHIEQGLYESLLDAGAEP